MVRRLIDLSRPISHMMPVANPHVNQVPAFWHRLTHESERGTHKHSDISFQIRDFLIGEHVGTHVDALCHFTPSPDAPAIADMELEWFFADAICVDVSHITPLSFIEVDDLKVAVAKTGLTVKPGSTFLYFQDYYARQDQPNWLHEFAGLTGDATHWLADQGVKNIGCETASIDCSTAMPKDANPSFPAHRACRDRGIINTENLANLDKVVGKAFTYIGLPLPLVGGTGSPIRAVALLEDA
ncbi:cyclase family protein [Aurantimonas sp. A2-1-M11]|uniref:cyclase family protein n=1 Tax=Aurantimonas sp. A2-1-M11 TaxID=3113712 RepID=UPI002F959A07